MSAVLVKPPADTAMPADQGPTDAKNASFRLICRDIIPGLRLCECAPDGNKKGAHLQPLCIGLGNLNSAAVLRPCLPRPQIINESISKLNDALTMGRYFYVEIVAKGIMLYDSGECQLATPGELDYAEIKKMAEEYYGDKFSDGLDFFKGANFYYQEENYHMTAFMLHQATESFLKTIPLVYILYGYKEHDLQFLIEKCKPYTLELAKVFPCDTDEEKRLFDLLRRAYLEARYNKKNFIVTKADIDALVPKIELLRDIVEKGCRLQIAYYSSLPN